MNRSDEFETADLGQAAYLLALGHTLRRMDGAPGSRRYFVFEPDAAQDANEYFRWGHIPAQLFHATLRELKIKLFPYR